MHMAAYQEHVSNRMADVRATTPVDNERELGSLRLIVFSDLHKGSRNGADDFAIAETTYMAALEYYWQQDFELYLLGDVEELWENWPSDILSAYGNVLNQELRFAQATAPERYRRFAGNHDDLWYRHDQQEQYLRPYLANHQVLESRRIPVTDAGQRLGELFLLHGHQGTADSDTHARLSAWLVHTFWRPLQRLFKFKSTAPSTSFVLRKKHDLAMYHFASTQKDMVLIAGHTHRPVWEGLGFGQAVQTVAEVAGMQHPEAARWMNGLARGAVALPGRKPCYFNSGCCCYSDGSITGLELADEEIRLIRWNRADPPTRRVLFMRRCVRFLLRCIDRARRLPFLAP